MRAQTNQNPKEHKIKKKLNNKIGHKQTPKKDGSENRCF
jgi:hypothetical protein